MTAGSIPRITRVVDPKLRGVAVPVPPEKHGFVNDYKLLWDVISHQSIFLLLQSSVVQSGMQAVFYLYSVIVEATPGFAVTEYATATVEEANSVQGQCDSEDNFDTPPAEFRLFSNSGFIVDWCQFKVYIYTRIYTDTSS